MPDTSPSARTALIRLEPIFPVRELAAALAHYSELGFESTSYGEGDDPGDYGFASRDGVTLHLLLEPDLDPAVGASATYLYVEDADALAAEWQAVPAGRTAAPRDTPYGLREGSHVDPDGNLIRFGSRLSS